MIISWDKEVVRSGLTPLDFAAKVYKERNRTKEEREKGGYGIYQPIGFKIGVDARKWSGKDMRFWYPHPDEVRPCCQGLAQPKTQYPWIYQRHCRTIRHVALLFNTDENDLREAVGKSVTRNRCVTCGKFRLADDYICKSCRKALDGPLQPC